MQIATTAFSIVPVHLFNIFIALLCSNHVNRSFGKGLVPRQYRLRWDLQADGANDRGKRLIPM